jgi:hypothetical protein
LTASTTSAKQCPECGADLKPGSTWCWLCNYKSPPPLGKERAQAAVPDARTNWMALAGFVLLALAFLPACAVAFFVSCSAILILDGEGIIRVRDDFGAGLLTGAFGAVIMAALIIVLMTMLFRSYHRSTRIPDSPDAR